MRIAISGSHRTGKSTLIEELAVSLPEYSTVEEPYHLLEEDGHEVSHPALEDLEQQLQRVSRIPWSSVSTASRSRATPAAEHSQC
jgi:hypothetical protein